ncbi:MAG: DUF4936 family protein [Pseudomonadota bacterium]
MTTLPARVLYVYYKLPAAEHAVWLPRVRAFQQQLRQSHAGLEAELLRRPGAAADGRETWMEVYRHPQGVDDAAMEAIGGLAEALGLPMPRASEVFTPL